MAKMTDEELAEQMRLLYMELGGLGSPKARALGALLRRYGAAKEELAATKAEMDALLAMKDQILRIASI